MGWPYCSHCWHDFMKQAAQVAESADPDKVDVAMDDLHQTGCMMDIVEVELSGEKRDLQ